MSDGSRSPPWEGDAEWPVRESVVAWETPFFEAGYDVVERPDGTAGNYYWVDPADAAVVVAVDDGEVVLVEQYRPRSRMRTLGLPGGLVDDGEAPRAAARRELREETGYRADALDHVETYVPSPWVRYRRHVYVATGLAPGEPDTDDGEFVETDTLPVADVIDATRDRDGPVVGGAVTPLLLAREDGLL